MKPVIVITGPTASGKSAAALALARDVCGEIINADAMQVYRPLAILTDRPTKADMAVVPHALYGVAEGHARWSAGQFARAAAAAIEAAEARGRLPMVVGGTGLWLKALTEGLSPVPAIPAEAMAEAAASWEKDPECLRASLIKIDPAMAALAPRDTQRHVRAWAVYNATGTPLSTWQGVPAPPVMRRTFHRFVLLPSRDQSYRRSDERVWTMLAKGALEEVAALLSYHLSDDLPVMKAVGVPEFGALLKGELSEADAVAAAQQATRRLIKRQTTWLNGQFSAWPRVAEAEALSAGVRAALKPSAS